MGLSTLEKIGLGIAGAFVGSYFFPETFYSLSFGTLGTDSTGQLGAIQPATLQPAEVGGTGLGVGLGSPFLNDTSALANAAVVTPNANTATGQLNTLKDTKDTSSFLTSLQQPQALGALFTAGAALGTTLLAGEQASDEADANREFSSAEREAAQTFRAEQDAITRDAQAAEAQKGREFAAEQQAADREFREEQERKARQFQAIVAAQAGKDRAFSNRVQSSRAGSSLAANVANLNQAVLA